MVEQIRLSYNAAMTIIVMHHLITKRNFFSIVFFTSTATPGYISYMYFCITTQFGNVVMQVKTTLPRSLETIHFTQLSKGHNNCVSSAKGKYLVF